MGVYNLGQLVGNDKVKESTPVEQTPVVMSTTPVTDSGEASGSEVKTIVLDGPLSRIYTEALNLAYANEGMSLTAAVAYQMQLAGDIKGDDVAEDDSSYVYCIHGDDLDMNTLNKGMESIRVASKSGKFKKMMLAVESGRVVTSKMQLLCEMAGVMGVKVYLSRDRALEGMVGALKKV